MERNIFLCTKMSRYFTSQGHQIRHYYPQLLNHMLSELESEGSITLENQVITEPRKFSAYALYATQKQSFETGTDKLTENFDAELCSDPTLYIAPARHSYAAA